MRVIKRNATTVIPAKAGIHLLYNFFHMDPGLRRDDARREPRAKIPFAMILLTASTLNLTACGSVVDKLSKVGQRPELNEVANPQTRPDYKPLSWPLPDPEAPSTRTSNSLWQPGSRAFFRDQRASRVGDILRVNVAIADQAKIDNTNNVKRDSDQSVSAPVFLGLERVFRKKITGNETTTEPLLDITGSTQSKSTGTVDRRETIKTQVAALVTQVLPNGNLAIDGSQEILINQEIREISVKGVIRPQDINTDNTIDSSQIAQARVVYSGRGQLTDIEKPRWGHQVIEAVAPF
jgi:flagellar L-ring protein precursor FlgH